MHSAIWQHAATATITGTLIGIYKKVNAGGIKPIRYFAFIYEFINIAILFTK